MDLGRTQLTGLLNNVTHEKTRFINLLYKLKSILNLSKDNKLILTSLDKLVLTSSPQVIYENLNFSHPVLKILIEFLQKTRKLGEGDKLLVEVLKKLVEETSNLLENGIKPKTISNRLKDISLNTNMFVNVDKDTTKENLAQDMVNLRLDSTLQCDIKEYIRRIIGDETISSLLIEAIEYTQSFDPEKIRICKVQSGSLDDSYRSEGMLINRLPEGCIKSAVNTSVGIFNCPFDITRTELKGTVLMRNSTELLNFSKEEVEMAKRLIDSLNVNVLIVSGTVNDLFVDFADSRNLLVLKIFNKYDLKRLCDLVGGAIYNTLGPIPLKGFISRVEVVHDAECAFTKIAAPGQVTTIVLKSSIREVCDEMERKILLLLENLQMHGNDKVLSFSGPDFFEVAAKVIGHDNVVTSSMSKAIKDMKFDSMIIEDKVRCLRYAFDFLATIMEIDDYLIAKVDQLDVKPKTNPHWDDD